MLNTCQFRAKKQLLVLKLSQIKRKARNYKSRLYILDADEKHIYLCVCVCVCVCVCLSVCAAYHVLIIAENLKSGPVAAALPGDANEKHVANPSLFPA